jgi:hypothetical protein
VSEKYCYNVAGEYGGGHSFKAELSSAALFWEFGVTKAWKAMLSITR